MSDLVSEAPIADATPVLQRLSRLDRFLPVWTSPPWASVSVWAG